ncbi:hypothetical protein [Streptomyces sp. AC627_RSS907]|uniref:hypothetical protein n=1 Tax=Streptomyces sp. AC627_RSS907 TaxID=2823684 RepID=UPI001C223EF6|nr:hypothetical protein [Streptomyces sp. AC627_RSS907]
MEHAADSNRAQWPEGVTVRAVLPLAPVYNVGGSGILFSIQWSPRSGWANATDDARTWGRPAQRQCATGDHRGARQRTVPERRRVALACTSVFFRRHLMDDVRFDAVLTGRQGRRGRVRRSVLPTACRARREP